MELPAPSTPPAIAGLNGFGGDASAVDAFRPTLAGVFAAARADLADVHRRYGRSTASTLLTNRGFHALTAYRVARWCCHWRLPLLPLLCTRLTQILYAIDLHPKAKIAGGVTIVHGVGVVIGPDAVVERGTLIYHGVTLGLKGGGANDGFPHVEADCVLGTGATLLGHIRVGAGSIVGPNAVLTRTVPPDSIVKVADVTVTARRGTA